MSDVTTITDPIDNYTDVLDSRDVIARVKELEELLSELIDTGETLPEDLAVELEQLRALAAEGANYAEDWAHGVSVVRESYFEDYYRELIEDTSDVNDWTVFPFNHIDWQAVAEEGKVDYTSIDFDGVTYWVR